MKSLTVRRVGYGKVKTLPEDREYTLNGNTVGTKSEWIAFGASNGYDEITFTDNINDETFTIKMGDIQ